MDMDKIDYLIKYLLQERGEDIFQLPSSEDSKKKLYRALVNLREPDEISDDFLRAEDEYLINELSKREITNVDDIKTINEVYENSNLKNADKICLWRGDITKLKIGAIVNAANSEGLGCFSPNHNCIDNQIHTFAGVRLRLECSENMKKLNGVLETGNAFITEAYNLPAEKVIHTVGPIIYSEVGEKEESELANCYINSLDLAIENNVKTISLPCISTGVFCFPKELACNIALTTVDNYLSHNRDKIEKIVFNLWSEEDVAIYERNI